MSKICLSGVGFVLFATAAVPETTIARDYAQKWLLGHLASMNVALMGGTGCKQIILLHRKRQERDRRPCLVNVTNCSTFLLADTEAATPTPSGGSSAGDDGRRERSLTVFLFLCSVSCSGMRCPYICGIQPPASFAILDPNTLVRRHSSDL